MSFRVSGCTDHFASTELEAYDMCRDIASTYNIQPVPTTKHYTEPLYDMNEMVGLIPRVNQHELDMYKVSNSEIRDMCTNLCGNKCVR